MTDDLKQAEYWEEEHAFREYHHPVVRYFATQRIGYMQQWLNLSQVTNALDVGCGNGFSTHYLQQFIPNLWGVDRSGRMLARHPMQSTGKLSKGDAFYLPFADNSFDLVYGWEVLHHMSQPELIVAEMVRVSRKYVLVAEPNRYNPAQFAFAVWNPEHRWVLRFSLPYLRHLFEQAHLRVEYLGSGGCLFPNITPSWLLSTFIKHVPYGIPFIGISNWALGRKVAGNRLR